MAKIFLHYTCCLIVLTICVDQGDGMSKKRAEETSNRHRGEEFIRKKERIDDIVREIDFLKDIAEMVDHHIDDFYEEYPKETKKEHSPKTRHYSHKSFHDWLTTERRPEATEQWSKSTKHRSKSTKKPLKQRFRFNFNDTIYDKQKNRLGEQPDSNNDFNLQKNTKIIKATTELLNKYHVKIQNRGKQYLHKSSDSEYDLENSKYSKTTEMKTTTESAYNYHATSKKYVDDDFNLQKNIRTKSAAEFPNKYYPHKDKYEGEKFGYHKNTKTTEKPTPEFPNKYYANSKIIVGDDFNFNKNIKTTDNTVYELQSKYRANSRKIEDDDYDFYKYSNTTGKTTSEFFNNYHGKKPNHEDIDFNFHKKSRTTEKSTSEFRNIYNANSKIFQDGDFNFHKNIKITDTTISEIPSIYHTHTQRSEDYDFNFQKNGKFPNKYNANNKRFENNDLNFNKNAKTTESTAEFLNKYYGNKHKYEGDNFNKNIGSNTTSVSPKKYQANKKTYDDDDFIFHIFHKTISEVSNKRRTNNKKIADSDLNLNKNAMSTDETTSESSNKYHKNTHNYDDKPFHTSNSEDKLDNTRYTTNTRMGKVHVDSYNSKKHKYDAKHSHKPSDIEEDPRDQGTHTTETRSITKYRKGYNSKESNNIRLHKLPNFDSKLETLQSTERTENKIAIPLKNNYTKTDKVYRNYVQEAMANTDGDVTKSPNNANTNEINTTAETQSSQSQPFVLRAAFEKYYQTEHKHNDKVLDFTETRSSDIGSHINTVPVTSSTENCDSSSDLSENGIESHRIQTEDKFGTKWTWPTFERLLEVMGKRYDWRNDRWIELKHHANQKMTNADFINNFQEKHKFSYSTIKLNSTKSRRNVVIAVTAVR